MREPWRFVRSTILQRLGKLTRREAVRRLPTGRERAYPLLHVGLTVGCSAPCYARMRSPRGS